MKARADRGLYPGSILGTYRLDRLIATGGTARVFLATQLSLQRRVAVKVLLPQKKDRKDFQRRFFLEASTSARLEHPHIVTIHDYGECPNGELYMAMEYLDGRPLSALLREEKRFDCERSCRIALQICRALRASHRAGVIHRDLKPGNIMIVLDDDLLDFAKVLDFGLVKMFEANHDLTLPGRWIGSPRYMSPEQIRCERLDPRTDIYSFGAVLFHMLAGRPPFCGASHAVILEQHLEHPVPRIEALTGEAVDAELERVVRRCLEKEPHARYSDADALISDLNRAYSSITGIQLHRDTSMIHGGEPTSQTDDPPRIRLSAGPSVRRLRAVAIATILIAIAAVYFVLRIEPQAASEPIVIEVVRSPPQDERVEILP